jgi:hypothetical protein
MASNDTYAEDRFRKAYAIKLRTVAIREVDKRLGLAIPEAKNSLGPSSLPYEV